MNVCSRIQWLARSLEVYTQNGPKVQKELMRKFINPTTLWATIVAFVHLMSGIMLYEMVWTHIDKWVMESLPIAGGLVMGSLLILVSLSYGIFATSFKARLAEAEAKRDSEETAIQ